MLAYAAYAVFYVESSCLAGSPRIGPMKSKAGEENDPWLFDEGRNVYIPLNRIKTRFSPDPGKCNGN